MDITSYILGRQSSGGGSNLRYVIVEELPQVGENNVIYLVPKATSKTNNYYDEYMYISESWELIGDTEVDLSNYQTKIDSTHKLDSDLVDDTNKTNKFVTTSEKTTWNAKYDKPSGGIPDTDLSSAVQTSLGKADTSIQSSDLSTVATSGSYADLSNTPTIPDELSDLLDDSTHRLVTDTEKSTWNDKQDVIQYATIPTASVSLLDKIVQYTGTTDNTYTNGYFYKCVSDGEETPTYSWKNINVSTPDTGWVDLPYNTTYFDKFNAQSSLKYRKIGNIVNIVCDDLKPKSEITGAWGSQLCIFPSEIFADGSAQPIYSFTLMSKMWTGNQQFNVIFNGSTINIAPHYGETLTTTDYFSFSITYITKD